MTQTVQEKIAEAKRKAAAGAAAITNEPVVVQSVPAKALEVESKSGAETKVDAAMIMEVLAEGLEKKLNPKTKEATRYTHCIVIEDAPDCPMLVKGDKELKEFIEQIGKDFGVQAKINIHTISDVEVTTQQKFLTEEVLAAATKVETETDSAE
jgi:hypothetical protein